VTLGGYHVVSLTKGVARSIIVTGAFLLVLGVAVAIQSATLLGFTGLGVAGLGGYLIALGTWQFSGRLLSALLSVTLVGAVLSLGTPFVRRFLFGNQKDPGIVGTHAYWLGTQWWHPLAVVWAIALVVTVAQQGVLPRRRVRDQGLRRDAGGRGVDRTARRLAKRHPQTSDHLAATPKSDSTKKSAAELMSSASSPTARP
jgi:hypothetical protein